VRSGPAEQALHLARAFHRERDVLLEEPEEVLLARQQASQHGGAACTSRR
jgi:hypothetical protein